MRGMSLLGTALRCRRDSLRPLALWILPETSVASTLWRSLFGIAALLPCTATRVARPRRWRIDLPLVLPPTIVGSSLLLLFGRQCETHQRSQIRSRRRRWTAKPVQGIFRKYSGLPSVSYRYGNRAWLNAGQQKAYFHPRGWPALAVIRVSGENRGHA
jgi:hypothetical protein